MLRRINTEQISQEVAKLCGRACCNLPGDVYRALREGGETSPNGRRVIDIILKNADMAAAQKMPICQDCGSAVVFVELGREVCLEGGDLYAAINRGVARGYEEGFLRKSMCHPFTRANTGDNTPAIVHLSLVAGDKLSITLAPKGGGADNTSRLCMLTPAEGLAGVGRTVLDTVAAAGANPCPPMIVSVAIGGNFEDAPLRAKKGLLRPLDEANQDPEARALEEQWLADINRLGIGPAGLGGSLTCLKVLVSIKPCHIASLPVAVNIQCHAARHAKVVL